MDAFKANKDYQIDQDIQALEQLNKERAAKGLPEIGWEEYHKPPRPLAERITQGRMHTFPVGDITILGQAPPLPGAHVAHLVSRPGMEANAELMVEAFNVAHETGLTPRELADALLRYDGWVRHDLKQTARRPGWLAEILNRLSK